MFDSLAVYGPGLTVYGPWLIGVIAGLVAFFVTAAIMGVVLRRRDHIRRGGPRRPLPGTIQPIQPVPLQPMRSREPSRQTPHIRWLLVFLAVALVGAVVVVLSTPKAKGDVEKHGRKGNMMVWREMLNGDCPKRDARIHDRCDLVCPDLPKVL
jgi:hypothetical protein